MKPKLSKITLSKRKGLDRMNMLNHIFVFVKSVTLFPYLSNTHPTNIIFFQAHGSHVVINIIVSLKHRTPFVFICSSLSL